MTPPSLSRWNWRRMLPEGENGTSQGTRLSTKLLLKTALLYGVLPWRASTILIGTMSIFAML